MAWQERRHMLQRKFDSEKETIAFLSIFPSRKVTLHYFRTLRTISNWRSRMTRVCVGVFENRFKRNSSRNTRRLRGCRFWPCSMYYCCGRRIGIWLWHGKLNLWSWREGCHLKARHSPFSCFRSRRTRSRLYLRVRFLTCHRIERRGNVRSGDFNNRTNNGSSFNFEKSPFPTQVSTDGHL